MHRMCRRSQQVDDYAQGRKRGKMKLIVEKQGEIVKAIKAEYTPAEWLVVEDAMRRFAKDREVNVVDRMMVQTMLSVEPVEEEREG